MFKKDPLQIIPFNTYGTSSHLYLRGRVLEDEIIDLSQKGILKVFLNSWKRFETDEIRYAKLILTLENGETFAIKADAEGYFLLDKAIYDFSNPEGWLNYTVSYDDEHHNRRIQLDNIFRGEMLIPSSKASFGVISDIDDTILHTGVASFFKWKAIFNTLLRAPRKRKVLEGTSKLYNQLFQGKNGDEANPIFYVSNSPWNLYRYLHFFLNINQFPKGPILLRDIRMPYDKTPKPKLAHKYHEIYNMLKTYLELQFILIGDSGEHDADIYLNIVEQYPDRIIAIYLRDVNHKGKRERILDLFKDYKTIPVLLAANTEEIEKHARDHGFIN